jgi:histidinol-phosphate aminotransferase
MLEYKLNEYIRVYRLKDYGKGSAPSGTKLDCSLGVNPEPIPPAVLTALKNITEGTVNHYPHDETVLEAIAKYYRGKSKDLQWLTKDNIFIGDGSTEILHNLNVMCLKNGAKVLGHAPQFTAYVDQIACLGAVYEYYLMPQSDKYKFNPNLYMEKMDASPPYDLFIVENPNNPTGQIINLSDIEKIAHRARAQNRILIVDEAYGDYMPIESSAINLIQNYSNVVVTRTFSKAFGMAGIRLGYIITSNEKTCDTLTQFKKIENQFNSNGLARALGAAFLNLNPVIPDLNQISRDKTEVMNTIKSMTIAATGLTTPIMTLYYHPLEADFDLQEFLWDTVKLWTVSCATYDGLDKGAIRLMLPASKHIDQLKSMLHEAESKLPK